jgi:hypothetical protein
VQEQGWRETFLALVRGQPAMRGPAQVIFK